MKFKKENVRVAEKTSSRSFRSLIRSLGPGIITAALVFGPGSLTINTKLGASFGFSLLWVLVLSTIFMLAFTSMSTRIGLNSPASFISRIKTEISPVLGIICGVSIFLITASFQAGNTIGASISFSELSGSPLWMWVAFFSLATILLLFLKSFYKVLERLMIGLVSIMLLCFLLTLIMAGPNLVAMAQGLIPSIPKGSDYLIITLTASSFSIVGAFYQSYLVREKEWKKGAKEITLAENRTGIITLGLLSSLVMSCASAVLYHNNISVDNASDLGKALEPLFGQFTSTLFMIGLFAASFSSMIGNATIGGVILSDTIFGHSKLSYWSVRSMIILVIIIGATVALIFGSLPLQLIIFAQGITILIVPLVAIVLVIFSSTQLITEELRNSVYMKVMGVLGILVLSGMSIYSIKYLFF
ncbi:divalent metal cation transporter [Muricauda sp. TY007]|uniref:Nramp family divalent metal transporter n=1 Tax=Allomuricauda sp. TY007 TaxID=2683200 RepID=UPI0013BF2FAB|nr:Nramp family divalent metal transporter [Muricauda sp. TY007]NDV16932.1 divalent metal cation transporter [Muricauda sp. TY007]